MMRSQWLESMVNVDAAPLLPALQHWRNFLYDFARHMSLSHFSGERASTSAPASLTSHATPSQRSVVQKPREKAKAKHGSENRRSQKAKEMQGSIFAGPVAPATRPDVVYWGDLAVMEGEVDNLTPNVTAEIIWNLFEQNFRFEIRHLDRVLLPDAWSTESGAGSREDQIRRMFPIDNNEILVAKMPRMSLGLVAEDWGNRILHVDALRGLMAGWPGDFAQELAQMILRPVTPGEFEKIEMKVTSHYCQTFFDQFGRAPCTPHQVPEYTPRQVPK